MIHIDIIEQLQNRLREQQEWHEQQVSKLRDTIIGFTSALILSERQCAVSRWQKFSEQAPRDRRTVVVCTWYSDGSAPSELVRPHGANQWICDNSFYSIGEGATQETFFKALAAERSWTHWAYVNSPHQEKPST